jgi:hypothetical protein
VTLPFANTMHKNGMDEADSTELGRCGFWWLRCGLRSTKMVGFTRILGFSLFRLGIFLSDCLGEAEACAPKLIPKAWR